MGIVLGAIRLYHIIINPAAGHGRALRYQLPLEQLFQKNGKEFLTFITHAPMDARALAREACTAGSEGIVAIGGDGTVQEIVAGMYDAAQGIIAIPLGIIPCGSGNDFSLALKTPRLKRDERKTAASFFKSLLDGRTRTVDIIRADGMACLNIANLGLDALIVKNAIPLKKAAGGGAYLASAVKSIFQHKNTNMRVEIDGHLYTERPLVLLAVCNGRYYGGGLCIAPGAKIDDGLITVCAVDGLPRSRLLAFFPSILLKQHIKLKAVRFIKCKRLTVSFPGTESLCMDGNLYEKKNAVSFEIVPGALKLFVP